ncbi:MAG: hypothetical protein ACM30I_08745 [Gemmatimonas sp.]
MAFDRVRSAALAADGTSDDLSHGVLTAKPGALSPSAQRLIELFREHIG